MKFNSINNKLQERVHVWGCTSYSTREQKNIPWFSFTRDIHLLLQKGALSIMLLTTGLDSRVTRETEFQIEEIFN